MSAAPHPELLAAVLKQMDDELDLSSLTRDEQAGVMWLCYSFACGGWIDLDIGRYGKLEARLRNLPCWPIISLYTSEGRHSEENVQVAVIATRLLS